MKSARGRNSWMNRWLPVLYALAYGVGMVALNGGTPTRLYGSDPYHRLQADALLKGHLYLADSIYSLGNDLAWHNGHVQQIWGLGVGLWLLPFEAIWRMLGLIWFPDRVALGVACALMAWYAARTSFKLGRVCKSPAFAIGFGWIVTLCPALLTLSQAPPRIYEETCLYACLDSLGILLAIVRVACFGERSDYLVSAVLSAMAALVRPTHGIYGMAGILVSSTILLVRRRNPKTVVAGICIFSAGLTTLGVTNWLRFGSPTEFGHRLSGTTGIVVFMTRFDDPMREATLAEAGEELFGLMFLAAHDLQKSSSSVSFPGMAPYARWRDLYLNTYDLSWALIIAVTLVLGAARICNARRDGLAMRLYLRRPSSALATGLFIWACLGTTALVYFYLYFACMSARYLLDFAPAFAGCVLILLLWSSQQRPRLSLIMLAVWLACEVLTNQGPQPKPLQAYVEIQKGLPVAGGRKMEEFHGIYTLSAHPDQTGIQFNGAGWDTRAGFAEDIVILALDRPKFVELLLGPRLQGDSPQQPRPDIYRAKMDNCFLPLREVRKEGDLTRVRFDVPDTIRRREGNELLFVCFSKGYDEEDSRSLRLLHSVSWQNRSSHEK